MIKISTILSALFLPALCFAQSSQTYYYKTSIECYVKEYRVGELVSVSDKQFQGMPLMAKKLNRNPQFMAFKVGGKIYLSPATCLNQKSFEMLDELDDSAFINPNTEEPYDNRTRVENDYPSAKSDFSKNNYFIELSGGPTTVSGKESVFQNYEYFDQTDGGDSIAFGKALPGKYKSNSSLSIILGKKASDSIFYTLKFRRFEGGKKEEVSAVLTSGGIPEEGTVEFDFKDTFTDLMIGVKLILGKNSSFKPFLSGMIGLSSIESKFTESSNTLINELELSSTGITAGVEAGFEYFFSTHFAIGPTFGYQYLGSREFRAKSSDGKLTSDTFKTKMDYSNTYLTLGLKVYFK